MKVHQLFESLSSADKKIIAIAKAAGEKLYGKSHTGLV